MGLWKRLGAYLSARSLRWRFLFVLSSLLALPLAMALYLYVTAPGEQSALVTSRRADVSTAARLLARSFPPDASALLQQGQIVPLVGRLESFLKLLNTGNPQLQLGYEIPGVAILAKGPQGYPGMGPINQVLRSRSSYLGTSVLGGISRIYAVEPVIQSGHLVGVAWASWVGKNVSRSIQRDRDLIIVFTIVGLFLGVVGAVWVINATADQVQKVKDGLLALKGDLSHPLPRLPGEMGEISSTINDLATALRVTKEYSQLIYGALDDGVLAVDEAGILVLCNPSAGKLLATDPAAALGQKAQSVLGEGHPLLGVLSDRLFPHGGKRLLLGGAVDRKIPVWVRRMPLLGDPAPLGVALVLHDLSEEERREAEARRNDRLAALGHLVAGVAHEVRNPLTSIRGYIEYWRRRGAEPETRAFGLVLGQVDRLNALVERLLSFSRSSERREPLLLGQVARETVQLLAPEARKEQVTLTWEGADGPPVLADPQAIEGVVMNLIKNAWEASPPGGTVRVRSVTDAGEGWTGIEVLDEGPGISGEDLDRAFDPFFTTKPGGTGLGLYISHEVIKAHHGRIELMRRSEGGTRAILFLPQAGGNEADE